MEGFGKRLTVGVIWTAGGRVIVNLLGIIGTLALARLLTPADFGLVALATVVLTIVEAVTELSLGLALLQHKSPQREHYDTAWTLGLCRSAIAALVMVGAAAPLAVAFQDERLFGILAALAAGTLVAGLINPRLVDFRRRLSFHQEIVADIITKVVGLAAGVGIALAFHSYWALVIATLASQLTRVALSYVLIPYRPRLSFVHWRGLFSFSGWMALSSGLNAINWRADHFVVGAMMGNSALGHYTVGDNLASLPVRESTAPIANVLFPAFARLQDDFPRLRQAVIRSQRLLVAAALPVGIGFALIAEPFIGMVLGPAWQPAALVVQVLGAIFAAQAFGMPLSALAMGMGRTRTLFIRDLINFVVRYPLIFAGVLMGGLPGLLMARCISGTVAIGLNIHLAKQLIGLNAAAQILSNWRAVAAVIAMALAVGAVGTVSAGGPEIQQILLMVMTGLIVYMGVTLALWVASGRPEGPEQEALRIVAIVRRRASGASASQGGP